MLLSVAAMAVTYGSTSVQYDQTPSYGFQSTSSMVGGTATSTSTSTTTSTSTGLANYKDYYTLSEEINPAYKQQNCAGTVRGVLPRRVNEDDDPDNPGASPIGDVPVALMLALAAGVALRRRARE